MGDTSHLLAPINSSFRNKRGGGHVYTSLIALFLIINLISTYGDHQARAAQLRAVSSSMEQSLAQTELKGQVGEQSLGGVKKPTAAPPANLLQQQLLLTAINSN